MKVLSILDPVLESECSKAKTAGFRRTLTGSGPREMSDGYKDVRYGGR